MWKITYDNVADRQLDIQSRGYDEERGERECIHKFRLRDDDGEVYWTGYSSMDDDFGPLDDYGKGAGGCTEIQYYDPVKKIWETL